MASACIPDNKTLTNHPNIYITKIIIEKTTTQWAYTHTPQFRTHIHTHTHTLDTNKLVNLSVL